MIDWEWIQTNGQTALMVGLSSLGVYAALIVATRMVGLRSYSKLSSFDFVITIAYGSLLASILLNKNPSLLTGIVGIASLFAIQFVVSYSRRKFRFLERLVDNRPLLLMAGPVVLQESLDYARITHNDLRFKLRAAGITHPDQVLAVVLENTGDVSVLRTGDQVDPWVLEDVRRPSSHADWQPTQSRPEPTP